MARRCMTSPSRIAFSMQWSRRACGRWSKSDSCRRRAVGADPEPYRHSFPKGDIFTGWSYPPKDEAAWAKWSKLVAAYAAHLKARYGSQTGTWLWEVWNEPDIPYWHGTAAEYDRLYDVTAAAIRQVLPEAKIGGPEATGVSDHSEPFLRQFLEHCAHGVNAATGGVGAQLDFISYHAPKAIQRLWMVMS